MFELTIADLLKVTGGRLLAGSPSATVTEIATDTRASVEGKFFVPLKGESFDGHDFAEAALTAGATGCWLERSHSRLPDHAGSAAAVVEVEDSLKALQSLAGWVRDRLEVPVVGITGSTGKTTTRDMLAGILGPRLSVVASEKNYNNEIGVPLTVLRADASTEVLVIEMAMRGVGQIGELAEIVRPTIGLVTNVGETHYELVGSKELIAKAKGELIEALPSEGVAVLNADDDWTGLLATLTEARVVTYGVVGSADVRGSAVEVDKGGRPAFTVVAGADGTRVTLGCPGRHNVYNACAAIAVAIELGVTLTEAREALAECHVTGMRMEFLTTADGIVIINDAYNANPVSTRSALQTLLDVETAGRRIAVLGDMLELGGISETSHRLIGRAVAEAGVDVLVAVGGQARLMADEAISSGGGTYVESVDNAPAAAQLVKGLVRPGDVVLVKASRALGLERVVEAMAQGAVAPGARVGE